MPRQPQASVLITTRNEGEKLRHLLDSLEGQKGLLEVVLVDSDSTDGTAEVAQSYRGRLPITVVRRRCTRGEGRNLAARQAQGGLLAFIDGDCVAHASWLEGLLSAWDGQPDRVVAGRTNVTGYWAFTQLHRVELPHQGQDTTWPACNLAYPRALFERLQGFDPAFVTAEDIDLNYRAVQAGAQIQYAPDAVVHARARESIGGFLRQAYWNGYGRKQLTRKHGPLWSQYSLRKLLRTHGGSVWGLLRIVAGFVGYMSAKLGRRPPR